MRLRDYVVCIMGAGLVLVAGSLSSPSKRATRVYADRSVVAVPTIVLGKDREVSPEALRDDWIAAGYSEAPTTAPSSIRFVKATPKFDLPLGYGHRITIDIRCTPHAEDGLVEWSCLIVADFHPILGKHPWSGVDSVVEECEARRRQFIGLLTLKAQQSPGA